MNKLFIMLILFSVSVISTGSAIGADAPAIGSDAWMDKTVFQSALAVGQKCDAAPRPVICADDIAKDAHMFELLGAKTARHYFAYRLINKAINNEDLKWETKDGYATTYLTDSKGMFSVTKDLLYPSITRTTFLHGMGMVKPDAFMNWCVETFWRTSPQTKREQLGRKAYTTGVAKAIARLALQGDKQDLDELLMVFEKEAKEQAISTFRVNSAEEVVDVETVVLDPKTKEYRPVQRHLDKFYGGSKEVTNGREMN
ncbi:hypothetical protein [Geomonas subterranea]|uniref:hypothetical protein n=1 Tax=Geomonas subterranea TaxID=2847989 RepID=UPI001CD40259|nr:hypothetical protein [Geomonas fuzhouensis]